MKYHLCLCIPPVSAKVALEAQLMNSEEGSFLSHLDLTHEATRWTVFKQLEETLFIHYVSRDIIYGGLSA